MFNTTHKLYSLDKLTFNSSTEIKILFGSIALEGINIISAHDYEHPSVTYPVKFIPSPVHRAGLFSTVFFLF